MPQGGHNSWRAFQNEINIEGLFNMIGRCCGLVVSALDSGTSTVLVRALVGVIRRRSRKKLDRFTWLWAPNLWKSGGKFPSKFSISKIIFPSILRHLENLTNFRKNGVSRSGSAPGHCVVFLGKTLAVTSLSQCVSQPRNINGYWQTVRTT